MLRRRGWVSLCLVWLILSLAGVARAWTENHVLADEVRIRLQDLGKGVVEHRLRTKLNGNVRQYHIEIVGVDPDAVAMAGAYVLPDADAISSSLDNALPVSISTRIGRSLPNGERPSVMRLKVEHRQGLRRGTYVWVFRYRSDFAARKLLRRDGAMLRFDWRGPILDDGLDNARVTFVVPKAPTAPRGVERPLGDDRDNLAATYLSEVRRGGEWDEIELMRSYAPKGESTPWAIRLDRRAIADLVPSAADHVPPRVRKPNSRNFRRDRWLWLAAAGLFVAALLISVLKGREVRRAEQVHTAVVPPLLPLPLWARSLITGVALVVGLSLQFIWQRADWGAGLVLLATACNCYGAARRSPGSSMRGPGRWLSVSEEEALVAAPRHRGAWLDLSTRAGRGLFFCFCLALSGLAFWLFRDRPSWFALVVADGVFVLGLFATARLSCMPPDMALAPAGFLGKVVQRLRKRKGTGGIRAVPRLRIPKGQMDADELRLMVVPRLPLRGFKSIEVGVSYALGVGAVVTMPEVLLRVVKDSPCDRAVAALTHRARISPGRRSDERVIALSPRFPSVRATVEIVAALLIKVADRQALAAHEEASTELCVSPPKAA